MSKQLQREVWALEKCSGCGVCVAACSKQVLRWNGANHPVSDTPIKNIGYTRIPLDTCTYCAQFCAEVCPRLAEWNPISAKKTIAARARGPVDSSRPNDVIRSILAAGLSAGLLDGVIMLDLDPWSLKPVVRIAETVEEIVSSVGVQHLWAPVFDGLNEAVFERRLENLAVVATPCAAQAIRKVRNSARPELRPYVDAIRLTVSVFCTGIYLPELIDQLIVREAGISTEHIKRLEMSTDGQSLQVLLWDGNVHQIPRQKAEEYTRPGCASCSDFLGESADLAVGSSGTSEAWSAVLVRTRTGDIFVRNGIQLHLLEADAEVHDSTLATAAGEKEQRARAEAFKALQILMLDALGDPDKRNEAIHQFTRLYRTPVRSTSQQMVRDGCTGC